MWPYCVHEIGRPHRFLSHLHLDKRSREPLTITALPPARPGIPTASSSRDEGSIQLSRSMGSTARRGSSFNWLPAPLSLTERDFLVP